MNDLRLVAFFNKKLVQPLFGYLKQGITPKKLALTTGLGVIFGLFPVVGSTTILCSLLAIVFRLNLAAINLVNFFVYPLQIVLIIPLIKLGEFLFGVNPMPYSVDEVFALFEKDVLLAFKTFGFANLVGIGAWLMLAIPIFVMVYFISFLIFKRLISEEVQAELQAND
ncbi:DUF2062 domain-containing protein [Fulvivirgaceae bacterium BMA10]|uniref:DUF2062 domain-containing protein n=1 Tax=Splendidivirga corallicola TaxID=3051826 RepID=A0ABT8KX97_9BACT|nr:DUF2062 domain-containing protein [Fulvivirgaceae bacterium BMA10]